MNWLDTTRQYLSGIKVNSYQYGSILGVVQKFVKKNGAGSNGTAYKEDPRANVTASDPINAVDSE
jgi:hypothetical protein